MYGPSTRSFTLWSHARFERTYNQEHRTNSITFNVCNIRPGVREKLAKNFNPISPNIRWKWAKLGYMWWWPESHVTQESRPSYRFRQEWSLRQGCVLLHPLDRLQIFGCMRSILDWKAVWAEVRAEGVEKNSQVGIVWYRSPFAYLIISGSS